MRDESPTRLFDRAASCHKQQNIDLAKRLYKAVLAIDPGFKDAWQNLSLIHRNEENFQKVVNCGKICSAIGGHVMPQTFGSAIRASMALKKADDAVHFLNKYLEHGGDAESVLGFCGWLLEDAGPSADVMGILSTLKQQKTHAETASFLLGFAHARLEDYREAVKCFKEVVRANPHHDRACYNLAAAIRKKALYRSVHHTYQVDIVGTCNLRCPSCPVGNSLDDFRPKGFMSVDLFGRIVAKATAEHGGQRLAFDLFNWGEPLLHPEIDAIIRLVNEAGHEVRLSTNLNQDRFLEKAVRANPKLIKISLSGYYQHMYGVTHRKGDINVVKSNMYKLRSLIDKHGVDTEVMIGYHLYRNNLGQDYDRMEALARELMFVFYTDYANLMPAENIVKCLSGDPMSSEDASLTLDRLLVQPKEIREELQDHNRQKLGRDCILRSGFTTINHDGSVALCCAVYNEDYNIAPSYIEKSFDELKAMKYAHKYCEECMENGADLLLSYDYPKSVEALKRSRFEEIRNRHTQG